VHIFLVNEYFDAESCLVRFTDTDRHNYNPKFKLTLYATIGRNEAEKLLFIFRDVRVDFTFEGRNFIFENRGSQ
jgi:hypothetical protein